MEPLLLQVLSEYGWIGVFAGGLLWLYRRENREVAELRAQIDSGRVEASRQRRELHVRISALEKTLAESQGQLLLCERARATMLEVLRRLSPKDAELFERVE